MLGIADIQPFVIQIKKKKNRSVAVTTRLGTDCAPRTVIAEHRMALKEMARPYLEGLQHDLPTKSEKTPQNNHTSYILAVRYFSVNLLATTHLKVAQETTAET